MAKEDPTGDFTPAQPEDEFSFIYWREDRSRDLLNEHFMKPLREALPAEHREEAKEAFGLVIELAAGRLADMQSLQPDDFAELCEIARTQVPCILEDFHGIRRCI